MKLTKERLNQLIKEVLEEHRGTPMKDRGIKGQQIAKEREEANTERTKREKNRKDTQTPALRALLSLGRGVISENDVEEDEDWVRIKKDSLNALLTEITHGELKATCNKNGYKSMEQWLRITNAFADAQKGKFGEEKK